MRGFGKLHDSPISPYEFGYSQTKTYGYDPEKAKALFAEAGWKPGPDGVLQKDGQPLKVTIDTPQNRYLLDAPTAEAVQGYLKAVGVDAICSCSVQASR
jgi:peptide/nickel transport system substrate-binding protein